MQCFPYKYDMISKQNKSVLRCIMKQRSVIHYLIYYLLIFTVILCFFLFWKLNQPKVSHEKITLDQHKLVYQGDLKDHKFEGEGLLYYPNGDMYKGTFKNGKFHGSGIFTSHEGWVYKGDFDNGTPNGTGTLTTEDELTYEGIFDKGVYQKDAH